MVERAPADAVIADLLSGRRTAEEVGGDLVASWRHEIDVADLQRLVTSPREEAAKAAAWALSELGAGAAPAFGAMAPLLEHASTYVRYYALDALVAGAPSIDAGLLSLSLGFLDSPEAVLAAQAMTLAVLVREEDLASAREVAPDDVARLIDVICGDEEATPTEASVAARRAIALGEVRQHGTDLDRWLVEGQADADDAIQLFCTRQLRLRRRDARRSSPHRSSP